MNRRSLLLHASAAAGVLLTPLSAQASGLSLDHLTQYANRITTMIADFTQDNPDGSQSTGRLYLQRPGRARLEYAPPNRALIIAGGGQLAIWDGRRNQKRPEQYPLHATPLDVILARQVNLRGDPAVVDFADFGDHAIVRAADPKRPHLGYADLVFTPNPLKISQIITVDGGGNETRIMLRNHQYGASIAASKFNISHETDRRGG
jgi:outer membrane lipoprotein-sorting protein